MVLCDLGKEELGPKTYFEFMVEGNLSFYAKKGDTASIESIYQEAIADVSEIQFKNPDSVLSYLAFIHDKYLKLAKDQNTSVALA
jgi:hypothetical protein